MSTSSGDRMMTPVPETEYVDTIEPLTPSRSVDTMSSNQSRTPSLSRTLGVLPVSPARPQQLHSVPSSPAATISADRSPAMTPPQKAARMHPFLPETGMVLGLEQLERQQDEAERRKQLLVAAHQEATAPPPPQRQPQAAPSHHLHTTPVMVRYLDDDTAPSSTLESNTRDASSQTGDGSLGSGDDVSAQHKEETKFERIMKNTKRRLSSNDFLRRFSSENLEDPAEEDEEGTQDSLIYGYLQKLGRNGKWQSRWFETDGDCLSYYKNDKRSKLLATLELEKVGAIVVNEEDPKGRSFTIQVLGRPYFLRAESRAACRDWVITLNRAKEAKLQQGNTKLINQNKHIFFRSPPDLLGGDGNTFTQGIVIEKPHRPRTRAVDGSTIENIEELIGSGEVAPNETGLPSAFFQPASGEETGSLSQVVLARWQKRKTALSMLASKLSHWARSLKKYRCTNSDAEADVRLDPVVHPPGHNDAPIPKNTPMKVAEREVVLPPKDPKPTDWIDKETSLAVKAGPMVIDPQEALEELDVIDSSPIEPVAYSSSSSVSSMDSVEDDQEPRELS